MAVAQVMDANALKARPLACGGNPCAGAEGVAGHRALTAPVWWSRRADRPTCSSSSWTRGRGGGRAG